MSIGTEIIQDAGKRIGAHSIAMPMSAGDIVEGLDILNAMLQLWLSWGIQMDVIPLDVPGSELNEPGDARNAIVDSLALLMAPNYDNGKVVTSEQLRTNARLGFAMLETMYQTFTVPNKVPSRTLPRGSGNMKGIWNNAFFADGDALTDA